MPRHSDPLLISQQSWNKSSFDSGSVGETLAVHVKVSADCISSGKQHCRLFTEALRHTETIDHLLGSTSLQLFCQYIALGQTAMHKEVLEKCLPWRYAWVPVVWVGQRWKCERKVTGIPECVLWERLLKQALLIPYHPLPQFHNPHIAVKLKKKMFYVGPSYMVVNGCRTVLCQILLWN